VGDQGSHPEGCRHRGGLERPGEGGLAATSERFRQEPDVAGGLTDT